MPNFRPVSALPSLFKVFKTCILERLEKHFKGNHLLDDNQFEFRAERLMVSDINQVVDAVLHALDGLQECSVTCLGI